MRNFVVVFRSNSAAFIRLIEFFHRDDLLKKDKLSQVRNALNSLQHFLSMDEGASNTRVERH